MSSLWTPDGERPIRREPLATPAESPSVISGAGSGGRPGSAEPSPEELDQAQMDQLEELISTPVEAVVANHAVNLFNLAGLHLSLQPPQLDQARLAIDAFAALLDGLAGRLGPDEAMLSDGLAQIRLAYVQVSGPKQPS